MKNPAIYNRYKFPVLSKHNFSTKTSTIFYVHLIFVKISPYKNGNIIKASHEKFYVKIINQITNNYKFYEINIKQSDILRK